MMSEGKEVLKQLANSRTPELSLSKTLSEGAAIAGSLKGYHKGHLSFNFYYYCPEYMIFT